MIEFIAAISLVLLSILLPVKWAFSLSLASSYSLFYYTFADVSTIMFVLLFLRIVLKNGIIMALRNRLFQNHGLLVGLSILSLIWASQTYVGISIVFAQLKVLIIAIVSLQIIHEKSDIKFVVYGAVAGVLYICFCIIGWKFGLFGVSSSEYQGNIDKYGRLLIQYFFPGRITPINSNTWASLAALSSILGAVYYFYILPKPKKIIKSFILMFVLMVTLITADLGSRTELFTIISGIIILFKSIQPRRFYAYLAGILLVLNSGLISFDNVIQFLPGVGEIYQSRLVESTEGEEPRILIWLTGLNMAVDNFVTGVGIGNAGVRFKDYMVISFENDRMAMHNSFLTHFAELGIFGLIIFIRGMYLWQKPLIYSKGTKALFLIISLNILLNAFAHSFELENYFIAIIYSVHAYFLLEMKEGNELGTQV
jgi:hypothetical protein